MKLNRDEAVIVFVGSFNPRIFHPSWMREVKIFTPKEAEAALAGSSSDPQSDSEQQTPARIIVTEQVSQVLADGIQVSVQSSRLVIQGSTQEQHERCFEIAAAIQRVLPHSPVSAMGLNRNFILELPSRDAWHKIGNTVIPKDGFWATNGEDPGTANASVQYERCKVRDSKLSVTIGPVQDPRLPLVAVRCNYHFEKRKTESADASGTSGRLDAYADVLRDETWSHVCADAFEIAERVVALATR